MSEQFENRVDMVKVAEEVRRLLADGRAICALDVVRAAGMHIPDAVLAAASEEAQARMPSGYRARYERYEGRFRLIIERDVPDLSVTEQQLIAEWREARKQG